MRLPEGFMSGLYGAGIGVIALAAVGFFWGGWLTGGEAQRRSEQASVAAIAEALTPYCVASSKSDPRSIAVLAELKNALGMERRGVIEKAGWATALGSDKPNSELAKACSIALAS